MKKCWSFRSFQVRALSGADNFVVRQFLRQAKALVIRFLLHTATAPSWVLLWRCLTRAEASATKRFVNFEAFEAFARSSTGRYGINRKGIKVMPTSLSAKIKNKHFQSRGSEIFKFTFLTPVSLMIPNKTCFWQPVNRRKKNFLFFFDQTQTQNQPQILLDISTFKLLCKCFPI